MSKTLSNFRGSPYYGFKLKSLNRKSDLNRSYHSTKSQLANQSTSHPKNINNPQSKLISIDKTKRGLHMFRDVLIPDQTYLPFLCSLRERPPSVSASKNVHEFNVASKTTFSNSSKHRDLKLQTSNKLNPFHHLLKLKSNKSVKDNLSFQSELREYNNPKENCQHTAPFEYINSRLERCQEIQAPAYQNTGQMCPKFVNTMHVIKRKGWRRSLTTIQ